MISCELMGGLGNQMFQIATVYSLSLDNNTNCYFDLYNGNFTQKPAFVYKNNVLIKLKQFDIRKFKPEYIYNEPFFNYSNIPYHKNMLLKGYFQSENYFEKNKDKIYDLFNHNGIISSLKQKYGDILSNSVSIHVRRGDYLKLQQYHPCPDINYYNNAYNFINSKTLINNVIVFSDDINWCKENIKFNNCTYIDNQNDYEDLYLMSLCDNNIIANSSFSWWGSWLNRKSNKIVIAPKKWFGDSINIKNWDDIYTKNMIVM